MDNAAHWAQPENREDRVIDRSLLDDILRRYSLNLPKP